MRKRKTGTRTRRLLIVGLFFMVCAVFFQYYPPEPPPPPPLKPLARILQNNKLTVITRNNAHCYFMYRDRLMGFEYDLAKAFADYLGVALEIRVERQWESMIPALLNDKGDLIAASMTITPKRQRQVAFSQGYMTNWQHLIVHRSSGISSFQEMDDKDIHVRKGTSYEERLLQLLNGDINFTLHLIEDVPTEELIRMVADRKFDATVADTNIALLNRRYYPAAVMVDIISGEEELGWAVKKGARRLKKAINSFFAEIRSNGQYEKLYNRYYTAVDHFDYFDLRLFHRRIQRRLPRYQKTIIKYANKYGFDWRLIAAQIYQESHFDPNAISVAGAMGLMQVIETTGLYHGAEDLYDPLDNIRTGVRHLGKMYDYFDWAEDPDRLYISLAAYNVGQGHVFDARDLAYRMGLDPAKWSSLEVTLPMLRDHKYYQESKYGYCRGTEPVNYVRQIKVYYDILRRKGIEYQR